MKSSFIGVKTTMVVCRKNCSAKPPLAKNTIKFACLYEAYEQGFRDCKVCTPQYDFIDKIENQSVSKVELRLPAYFSFQEMIDFIDQEEREILFTVANGILKRLFRVGEKRVLVSISSMKRILVIRFVNHRLKKAERLEVTSKICDWLDLNRNLAPFYKMGLADRILGSVIRSHKGLRMIRIPDLFEALIWAIIGQQVNLTFAHEVKGRFIKRYGEEHNIDGTSYYLFPRPQDVVDVEIEELKQIQLSQRKAEYIKEVCHQLLSGCIDARKLKAYGYEKAMGELTAIRGIGPWTADYVLMKAVGYTQAYPVGDAGLQNAVKNILDTDKKPTEDRLRKMAKAWKGWESYATFFLWRSLSG